jgi:hypothetical protein
MAERLQLDQAPQFLGVPGPSDLPPKAGTLIIRGITFGGRSKGKSLLLLLHED